MRGRFRGGGWVGGVKRWGRVFFPWSCGDFCGWHGIGFSVINSVHRTLNLYISVYRIPNFYIFRHAGYRIFNFFGGKYLFLENDFGRRVQFSSVQKNTVI